MVGKIIVGDPINESSQAAPDWRDVDNRTDVEPGGTGPPICEYQESMMASAPQGQLPLFYNQLAALSSVDHAEFRVRPSNTAPFLANHHAVPLTVEEFPLVQRRMPIVFSVRLGRRFEPHVDHAALLRELEAYFAAGVRR